MFATAYFYGMSVYRLKLIVTYTIGGIFLERMKELVKILNNASKCYYQENRSIMSDMEYDKLYDELLELEKKTGIILSDSPTVKVGYEVLGSLEKVRHQSKMLSLDKTKEVSKLKSFLGENIGVLSWKLDGLTVVLKYQNGELVEALTRGNGEVGENITHNAKVFKNIPLKISYNGELVIRGEAVIPFKDFEKINEELDESEKYKNPRNLCSGTVRQLNSEIAAKRNVCFIAFSLVSGIDVDFSDSKLQKMKWLESLGFQIVESKVVTKENIEDTVYEFEKNIEKNDFASDGLVLTYDSISYSNSLGTTAKFPKDSIAFKWKDEIAETTLIDIIWNTSRTGLINPIAVFEPVELEGTTVNKASLHNLSIVENLKLGIGDRITVYKANMIIPQVAENLTKSNSFVVPEKCAVCGGETEVVKMKDGKALKCINPNCEAQAVLEIVHYASRDALNIEGFSEATVERFVQEGFIKKYTDLYSLEKFKDNIIALDGFGEKSYTNLINSIEKSKDANLENFVYALGINNVGLSNARLLCGRFDYDFEKIKNATLDELVAIDGFGEIIAMSIKKYFDNPENMELAEKALSYLRIRAVEKNEKVQTLEGKVFVITGDVHHYKNRKELQKEIESLGGKVTSSVTGKTTYLINNDIDSGSSKNKKAKELGVEIITEDTFIEMIEK